MGEYKIDCKICVNNLDCRVHNPKTCEHFKYDACLDCNQKGCASCKESDKFEMNMEAN